LQQLLITIIKTKIKPKFGQIRDKGSDQQQLQEHLDQVTSEIEPALQELVKNQQCFIEMLLNLQKQVLNLSDAVEIEEILTRSIKKFIHILHDEEFLEEEKALQRKIPNIWAKLAIEERKLLASSLYFFNNNELIHFAAINLGIVFKHNIIVNNKTSNRHSAQALLN